MTSLARDLLVDRVPIGWFALTAIGLLYGVGDPVLAGAARHEAAHRARPGSLRSGENMPVLSRSHPRRRHAWRGAVFAATIGTLTVVSTATAHDFWIIPDLFAIAGNSTSHINGRSGTRFPAGSAVQPARVADARIIGAAGQTKITEMSVEGGSLRLHQKPATAGQYLVAVKLTPRVTRSTPAGLLRFLRAESASAEAARLERDHSLAGLDSVVYDGASYASTVIQYGRGGPSAFAMTAGYSLEFVPVNDPTHLHRGDTLHVKVMGGGKAVAGIGIDAIPAADTSTPPVVGAPSTSLTLTADANGVVHIPLGNAGLWLLRSAFVSRKAGGNPNEFEVARSTYVFSVNAKH